MQLPRSHIPPTVFALSGDDEENLAGSSRGDPPRVIVTETSFNWCSRFTLHWVNHLFTSAKETGFASVDQLPFEMPESMDPIASHCQLKLALDHYKSDSVPVENDIDQSLAPLLGEEENENEEEGVETESSKDRWFLLKSLNKAFGWTFWPLNLVKFAASIMELSSPVLLNLLLRELESGSPSLISAGIYLAALLLINISVAFLLTHLEYEVNKLEIRMKGSVISELISKTLCLNTARLKAFSFGKITNFVGEDSGTICCKLGCILESWYIPLKLAVILVLMYTYIGISFLAGLGFCLLVLPLNQLVASKFESCEERLMKHRDKRVKLVHEVVTNMKATKFFAWEEKMIDKISKIRFLELKQLKMIAYLDAISVFFWAIAPPMITFLIILMHAQVLGSDISASLLFTTLALVGQLIEPLNSVSWVVLDYVMAWVSLKRVGKFLNCNDNAPTKLKPGKPLAKESIIEVDYCSFFWKTRKDCCLLGLHFQVRKGELMVVMGKTGSGKSSLLHALSQELNLACGELRLKEWKEGSGLVLQNPWLKPSTIKDNILDGCVFDLYWYEQVVHACALEKDLQEFADGDETQIGINGSTLSGGQRVRIALARAVYKNKQVYLIDDIFAGLDSNVSLHIFENCINGLLANKTRVVCTHNIQLTAMANSLLILDQGQIQYIGPPQTIDLPDIGGSKIDDSVNQSSKANGPAAEEYEEMREYGAVDFAVYKYYIKSAGIIASTVFLLALIVMQITDTSATVWLTIWSQETSDSPGMTSTRVARAAKSLIQSDISRAIQTHHYLTVYAAIISGNIIFTIVRALSYVSFQINATKSLHEDMLHSVMQAPLDFFSFTPVGVIINRFSSDIYTIDSDIPIVMNILVATTCVATGWIFLTCYGLPLIMVLALFLAPLYYYIQKYYRTAARELKRLFTVTQSPLFNHFEETLSGVSYIHSFRSSDQVQNKGMRLLRAYQKVEWCLSAASAWLELRLQLISSGVIAVACGIILYQLYNDAADPASLGLGLTFALSINSILNYLISSFASLEKDFVSAERVIQFIEKIPKDEDTKQCEYLPPDWPFSGDIEFSQVSIRYKDCSTLAVSNTSFSVQPGSKVAIVGRTGAGKSTLLLALFKLVNLDSGSITIDGRDISGIRGVELRRRLSVIPQHPFLISGSFRENVDPFGEHSDSEILGSLAECGLTDVVDAKGGLDFEVSKDSLSAGECQLLCLARAILKKSKIICLDEATSNLDKERDLLIQQLLRYNFRDSTVITIAHRLGTILDYDRVLVVSDGTVVEDGVPRELLERSNSHFYKLAKCSDLSKAPESFPGTSGFRDSDSSHSSSLDHLRSSTARYN